MTYLAKDSAGEREAIRWLEEAAKSAKEALCDRAKCGTVIVKNDVVIGRGFNAPPSDNPLNKKYGENRSGGKPGSDRTCCMHAEWRAMLDALRHAPEELLGSKLYFTRVDTNGNILRSGQPYCTVCSRMALDVGIETFVLWHEEGVREYGTSEYNDLSYAYTHHDIVRR